MKTVLASLALAALVAVGVSALLSPAPAPPAPSEAAIAALRDAIDGVRAQVDALRARLDETERAPRVEIADAAPSPATPRCDPHCESVRIELERLRKILEGLQAATARVPFDLATLPTDGRKRSWGPEQATGPPDTPQAGDFATAWASRTPDDENEWLLLEFPKAVRPSGIYVHETYNPGALSQVSVFDPSGNERFVWGGADPTPPESLQGISWIPFTTSFETRKVKLHLHSVGVPGWNEIDAVALVDPAGNSQWASAATASSTYASIATAAGGPLPLGRFEAFR